MRNSFLRRVSDDINRTFRNAETKTPFVCFGGMEAAVYSLWSFATQNSCS